jgi:hypothetical protein
LAGLSARSTTYDRAVLAAALGDRGRWFVHQNPEWQRLAMALDASLIRPEPVEGPTARIGPPLTAEQVENDPELLLRAPDPWPDVLVGAALDGLVGGRMGSQTRSYARRLGRRLAEPQYAVLGSLAQRFLELPHLSPASRRAIRSLFVEIERVAYEVVEIEHAFDPSHGRVSRLSIPPV